MNGGSGPAFVDTNILVYAIRGDDPVRSPVAGDLVVKLVADRAFRTSTQVLQELFVTLTRKDPRMNAEIAIRYLDEFARPPVTVLDYPGVRQAAELSFRASLSMWDALIVVAAERSGARVLYTEDMKHGQRLAGVEIVNPFLGAS